ncbi:hypothetical protein D3C84_824450 [compost metagenome]
MLSASASTSRRSESCVRSAPIQNRLRGYSSSSGTSGCRLRATAKTRAPLAHRAVAMARPMPPLAPVNTTRASDRRMQILPVMGQAAEHIGVQPVDHCGGVNDSGLIVRVFQLVHESTVGLHVFDIQ